MSALARLGISEDSEQLYRNVLRADARTPADCGQELQWSLERVEAAAAPLIQLGLIHRLQEDLVAPDPQVSLLGLVDRETAQLNRRRRDLEEVAASVGDYRQVRSGGRKKLQSQAYEQLEAIALPTAIEHAVHSSSGPIRSMHLSLSQGPVGDDGINPVALGALQSHRVLRALYLPKILQESEQLEWVRQWGELGQEQRLSTRISGEFMIFDQDLVIVGNAWGEPMMSGIRIRMPIVVAVFNQLFEDAWAQAVPRPDAAGATTGHQQLLGLLASGFKDEAIARYMGLGVRTVRRRVADLMADLDVQTRYQLGVSVQQRGLTNPGPRASGPGSVAANQLIR